MEEQKKVRCAIYTRKSTEEGLDKEYNTLEAQRDAGLSYIKSQAYQGWVALDERYDDGGYSGGNMERPALQRLLEDVKQDKIDMIVVYKIDRLSRSLIDFSKLIEVLDAHKCSFVSVTQNFNTCDSMGRLTLNILLSFAQFERELDAERIRDKVAASKKRGMWMGGVVPIGYDVVDKKLVINKGEAQLVKLIFDKYCELKSERSVTQFLNQNGYKNKARLQRVKGVVEAKPFSHLGVNFILRNTIYLGKVKHNNVLYPGLHEAIISEEQWNKVQIIKKHNSEHRFQLGPEQKSRLLQGLIECGCCHCAMMPTHTTKNKKRYEYYVSWRAVKEGYNLCELGNVPAGELENFVLNKVQDILKSPKIIDELARQLKNTMPEVGVTEIFNHLKNPSLFFDKLPLAVVREILEMTISKIILHKDCIVIRLFPFGREALKFTRNRDFRVCESNNDMVELVYNISLAKKRGRLTILPPKDEEPIVDDTLFQALGKAHVWQSKIDAGSSFTALSKKEGLDRSYMARVMSLTRLAPDIIEAIIAGRQPLSLKISDLIKEPIPVSWVEQRKKYGFI